MDDLSKIENELQMLKQFFEQLPDLGVTHVLDCGKCEATLYDIKNDRVETMDHDHILALHLKLEPGDHVVCESAHLGVERKNRSLSQPFDRFKLSKIYRNFEENGIRLSLFPQQTTNLARRICKFSEKSDETDVKAIACFLQKFPQTSLANPPKSFDFSDSKKEAFRFKAQLNADCNFARFDAYEGVKDLCSKWIMNNLEEIADNLSETARDAFGLIERKRNGEFKNPSITGIYSVSAILLTYDGQLRKRKDTDSLAGWHWTARNILSLGPYHFRGGVARSTLMYHCARHYIARKMDCKKLNENNKKVLLRREEFNDEQELQFRYYRSLYRKSIRELFQVVKRMLEG
jgi:hypothetical protein